MSLEFSTAKTGDKTCSISGKYLHSKYNPLLEGERFAQNVAADFSPFCVAVLEPALSYCARFLKKRFPDAKICCIRFTDDFHDYDSEWDYVFYGAKENFENLSEDLFNTLGEENLISSLFFDWQPSKSIFPEMNFKCWKEIQAAVLKARDVIGTRAYFSKRWLKNAVLFSKNIKQGFVIQKIQKPVLIVASGPSLETSIPFIKKYREIFFVAAVSSAFLPLAANEIEPDMTLSSDGGFWAKRHLFIPGKNHSNHIFALEAESACFSKIYEENEIIPLSYEDGLEKALLKAISCPFVLSRRNGTVAGTALELMFSLSTQNIFLCGFDQAPSQAFQHTQPNALEIINQKNDSRLSTKETRITKSRFGSEKSLEIYRNWFVSNSKKFSKRVFRISDNYDFPFGLGEIKDISWRDFKKTEDYRSQARTKTNVRKADNEIHFKISLTNSQRKEKIISEIKKMSSSEFFLDEVFPMEKILIKREINQDKKQELIKAAQEKAGKLIDEIGSLF